MVDYSSKHHEKSEYPTLFHWQTAPINIGFSLALASVRCDVLSSEFTYCDLGCGQGTSTLLLAASNPSINFIGIDFNAAHIAHANKLREKANIKNVHFFEARFEEMLEANHSHLPDFDVAILHGVYSWVSESTRHAIINILNQKLRPGGIAYVSYNCSPGWATRSPLNRLLREYASRHPAPPENQISDAFAFAKGLAESQAWYFFENPSVEAYINLALQRDADYLAHEHLQSGWWAPYHADVASDMKRANLTFACSANLMEDILEVSIADKKLREEIRVISDVTWAETLKDFATPKAFRRDIFVKDFQKMSSAERNQKLERFKFILNIKEGDLKLDFNVPIGSIKVREDIYKPIVAALSKKSLGYNELLKELSIEANLLNLALKFLVHSGQIKVGPHANNIDVKPAHNLNIVLLEIAERNFMSTFLSAPFAASAIPITIEEMAYLIARHRKLPLTDNEIAERVGRDLYQAFGAHAKDRLKIQNEEQLVAYLRDALQPIIQHRSHIFEALGVVGHEYE